MSDIRFATYAAGAAQLAETIVLTESLRDFGGRYSSSPMTVFLPAGRPEDASAGAKLADLGAAVQTEGVCSCCCRGGGGGFR
jgi:hypothetical protein